MSLNGNEPATQTHVFPIDEKSQVGEARRYATIVGDRCGFNEVRQGRLAIVVNELGGNLLKYAHDGQLLIREVASANGAIIEILSVDRGPGIPDCSGALVDGFTTGRTPGTGLGAVKRLSDEFGLHSVVAKGTVVLAQIHSHDRARSASYQVGVVSIPMRGERLSGDGWTLHFHDAGFRLAVVDGLGHGPLAHAAANEAIAAFSESDPREDLEQVMGSIHSRLKVTRGAAAFLLRTSTGEALEFTGVGNVRAVIYGAEGMRGLMSQNGTAGVQIRRVHTLSETWAAKGKLILHTDGITTRWTLDAYPGLLVQHPAIVAATIHRDFCRGTDDATVVVINQSPGSA